MHHSHTVPAAHVFHCALRAGVEPYKSLLKLRKPHCYHTALQNSRNRWTAFVACSWPIAERPITQANAGSTQSVWPVAGELLSAVCTQFVRPTATPSPSHSVVASVVGSLQGNTTAFVLATCSLMQQESMMPWAVRGSSTSEGH